MGVSVNAQRDSKSDYVHSIHDITRILSYRLRSFLRYYDWYFRFTEDFQKLERALKTLRTTTNSVLQKKLQNTVDRSNDYGEDNKMALLDLLLKKRDMMPEELLSTMVEGFMFAVSNV